MYRFHFLNSYYLALFNQEPINLIEGINYIDNIQKRQKYFICSIILFMEYIFPLTSFKISKFSNLSQIEREILIKKAENSNFLFLRQFTSKIKMILSILYFSDRNNQIEINFYAKDN